MKTKKISWQAIAIVVLALVLIASIALRVSGAWFQDRDAVQQTSKMGEAVTIRLAEDATNDVKTWSKLYKDTKPYPGDTIMGKTQIIMGSTTPSVVRGKIDVEVTKKGATESIKLDEVDKTATAPTPVKKEDYYEVVDGVSNFKQSEYDAAVAAYKTAAEKYDLKLLAEMLDVTLAKNTAWEKGATTYYYLKNLAQDTNPILLFNALQLSTELSNEVAEWTISVKVSVEAIQAANLAENTEWTTDIASATTIKGAVEEYNTNRKNP